MIKRVSSQPAAALLLFMDHESDLWHINTALTSAYTRTRSDLLLRFW